MFAHESTRPSGNQYRSRKRDLLTHIDFARECLRNGYIGDARRVLAFFWRELGQVPASTRRRWKCGR